MKTYKIAAVSAALVIGVGTVAFAGPIGIARPAPSASQQCLINELQLASAESRHQAALDKGAGRALRLMKTLEFDQLIEQLERGEQVSPNGVYKAMRPMEPTRYCS